MTIAPNSKPWICPSAWNGAYYTHSARIAPCCRLNLNWALEGHESAENHPALAQMRKEMLAGIAPKGCEKCVEEEYTGIESKRQSLLKHQPDIRALASANNAEKGHEIIEVGLELGNSCNLACIICNPSSSSAWNKDAEIAGYVRKPLFRGQIDRLRAHLPHMTTLQLLGGETFLVSQLQAALELVVNEGNSEQVLLKISTNATIFPKPEIIRLLDRFAMVHIDCSLDAIGPRNDYIRFPSRWSQLEEVMARWIEWRGRRFNADLFLAPTVSAYSFAGLPDLMRWWQDFSKKHGAEELVKNYNFGFVSDPVFQAAQVLPRTLREKVALELRNLPAPSSQIAEQIIAYCLKGDHPENLPKLLDWTSKLDQARGISAKAAVPELFTNLRS